MSSGSTTLREPAVAPGAKAKPDKKARASTAKVDGDKKSGDKKKDKPPKKKRPLWQRLMFWGGVGIVGLMVAAVSTVAIVFWIYGRDPNLPDYRKLSDYHPRQVTTIVDAEGQRIAELFGRTLEEQEELKRQLDNPALTDEQRRSLQKKLDEAKKDKNERRTFVEFDKVPRLVVDAFVAAEDNSFWTHGGVDYWGMFRAFYQNLRAGKTTQGASTITQQVVKNLLLTPERTFKRKIQEIILARRLESALTKEEIITIYMNEIYFGHQRYGVQEAARYYFAKDVAQLNAGEAAILAAIPKEPETYANSLQILRNVPKGAKPTPEQLKKAERVKARQIYVLNQMVEGGTLTAEAAQKWIDEPMRIAPNPFPRMDSAPEWREMVRKELMAEKCKSDVETCPEGESFLDSGAMIKTTLDGKLQASAQRALQKHLRAFDKRHKHAAPIRKVSAKKIDDEIAKLAKARGTGSLSLSKPYEAVVLEVHDDDKNPIGGEVVVDLGNYRAALVLGGSDDERFNPPVTQNVPASFKKAMGLGDGDPAPLAPSARFHPGDVLEVVALADPKDGKKTVKHADHRVVWPASAEGAIVVIDVHTRKVRALVGGYSTRRAGFNRASMAHRQPGSSFKPFVYAAAIDRGADKGRDEGNTEYEFTAATRRNDAPENDRGYTPKNYETGSFEGPVLLRHALAKSINTVSVILTERVGAARIAELAKKMGISSKLPSTNSIALGSGEVTPLEMTNAVATLAAGGVAAPPRFIDEIDGVATQAAPGEQVLRPEVAYVVTNMMESVVKSGTGHLAKELGIPVAGKTGTSNDARDVWFIGMTPDYVIGVWVGYDAPKPMGKETGGGTAVPIFIDVAKSMNLKKKEFPRPAKVVEKKIDKATGLLPAPGAAKDTIMPEVFVEGTEPTKEADPKDAKTEANQTESEYEDKKPPEKKDKTDGDDEDR
jgi:penicillin-binding protein 1A